MKGSYIALGFTCNHACVMCPIKDSDRANPPYDVSTVMQGIRALDLQAGDMVTISGGEPTLVSYLPAVLSELTQRGVRMTILTNGTGFADMGYTQNTLANIPVERVRAVLAVHSASPDVHDSITGCPGSHAAVLKALKNLSSMGVHVCVKIILNAITAAELEGTATLIKEYLPPSNTTVLVTSTDYEGRAGANHTELFATFPEMRRQTEEFLDSLLGDPAVRYNVVLDEMPLCSVDPYYWCLFRPSPIRENSLPEVFSSSDLEVEKNNQVDQNYYLGPNASKDGVPQISIMKKYRRQGACVECDVSFACRGVWSSAYEIGGSSLVEPVKARRVQPGRSK